MSRTLEQSGGLRKFLVVKTDDMKKYLNVRQYNQLSNLMGIIHRGRSVDGKPQVNEYTVINMDESYIDEIIAILKNNGHWG